VQPGTSRQYASRIAHMRTFMLELEETRFSIQLWASYVKAMAPEYVTLEGHRAALLFAQRASRFGLSAEEQPWADSELAKVLVRGANFNRKGLGP